jgi:hypothetical protein
MKREEKCGEEAERILLLFLLFFRHHLSLPLTLFSVLIFVFQHIFITSSFMSDKKPSTQGKKPSDSKDKKDEKITGLDENDIQLLKTYVPIFRLIFSRFDAI